MLGAGERAGRDASDDVQAEARERAIEALARASGFLRGAAARSLGLRYAPELVFEPDTEVDAREKVERILDSSKRRRLKSPQRNERIARIRRRTGHR